MTCAFGTERLWGWVQGEEDAAGATEVEAHLATCPICSSAVREMQTIADALGAVGAESGEAVAAPPNQLGGFTIIRRLGQGGMGVVYEAEQHEPQRRVALKVVRGGLATDEYQKRLFAREAQTLARLSHPNIAAIFAAGQTPAGERYFAMELIDGAPLLQFVRGDVMRGPLSLPARLKLFLTICEAIRYAHQRGVMHRDLKPSNILVDRDGRPKVLDFGLARVLEEGAESDADTTRSGTVVGTLQYMSPEQARGDVQQLDIRTDVYALGVMLFELVAERLPYQVGARPLHEAVRIICEAPAPNLRRVAVRAPADLATICAKALEKEPARRYASAGELAADLGRFLSGHPIAARPASRWYRFRRLVARNAVASGLLALLFVAISTAGVIAAVQAQRVARERDRVALEAKTVAEFNAVLENLWQSVDPWRFGDRDVKVRDVLNSLAARVEQEMADSPILAARVRHTLGVSFRTFGTLEEFRESERHLRFAYDTRKRLLGPTDLETATSANELGETLYWLGDADGATPLFEEALATRRQRLSTDDPDLAESLNNLGQVAKQRGAWEAAARYYDEALQIRAARFARIRDEAAATHRARIAAADELAESYNNRGALRRARAVAADTASAAAAHLLDEALADYSAALDLRESWLGRDHPDVATMHNNLAKLLQNRGEYGAAAEHFGEAREILAARLGAEHQLIARVIHNQAILAREAGRRDDARRYADEAAAMRARLLGPTHDETRASESLAAQLAGEAH